jgi:hypothetical protein
LTCSNSVGTSTASTATLTATAAATTSSSSGGGGLDGSALLGLAGLCGARWLGARRRRTA